MKPCDGRVRGSLLFSGLLAWCWLARADGATADAWFEQLSRDEATDLVLLLDRTRSVGAQTFLTREKPLLGDLLLYHVNMAPNRTRVAVATFANTTTRILDGITADPVEKCDLFEREVWNNMVLFNQDPEENDINAVDKAFRVAHDIFLNSKRYNDTVKILLIATNGDYKRDVSPDQEESDLDMLGVTRYVIGVGDWESKNDVETQGLASDEHGVADFLEWRQMATTQQHILARENSTYSSQPTNQSCSSSENSYCNQQLGYSQCTCDIEGTPCGGQADPTSCAPNPCHNGATCSPGLDTVVCRCGPGFHGRLCQLDQDECTTGACGNGGNCTDGINHYTCDCQATGYDGDTCQDPRPGNTPTDFPGESPDGTGGTSSGAWEKYRVLIIASPIVLVLIILVASAVYCASHWKDGKIKKAVVRRLSTIRKRPLSMRSPQQPRDTERGGAPPTDSTRHRGSCNSTEAPPSTAICGNGRLEKPAIDSGDAAIYGNVQQEEPAINRPVASKPILAVKPALKPLTPPKPKPAPPKDSEVGRAETVTLPGIKAPPSRPQLPDEVAKEIENIEPQTYTNAPLSLKMSSWLGYVCDVMSDGQVERLCVVHMEGHMWITTERRFQPGAEQRQALLLHLQSSSHTPITLLRREYEVTSNDGTIAVLVTKDNTDQMAVGRSAHFLVLASSPTAPQSLLQFEVNAILGHLIGNEDT